MGRRRLLLLLWRGLLLLLLRLEGRYTGLGCGGGRRTRGGRHTDHRVLRGLVLVYRGWGRLLLLLLWLLL